MEISISKIIRSNRRSISFEIHEDATLVVRAPLFLAEKELYRILEKKKEWIISKQRSITLRNSAIPQKKFNDGERFLYLGDEYSLRITRGSTRPLEFENEFLLSYKHVSQAKELFISWYKDAARRVITERVREFSNLLNANPAKVTITSAVTRWGSCTGKNVNFSWRLIMAPLPTVDYVVVHELVHIFEKNHSSKFWERVATAVCDYKAHRHWLKSHGHLLSI